MGCLSRIEEEEESVLPAIRGNFPNLCIATPRTTTSVAEVGAAYICEVQMTH